MSVVKWYLCSKQATANSSFMPGPPAPYPSGPPTTYHQAVPPVPSVPGTNPNQLFNPAVPTNPTSRFMPSNNQGFVQHPGPSPVQPSSPTHVQPPAQPAVAPPAPPPTVQTVDTSNVSGTWIANMNLVDYMICFFTCLVKWYQQIHSQGTNIYMFTVFATFMIHLILHLYYIYTVPN
jgi:hypothetical protein